jgi:hypothetical protein
MHANSGEGVTVRRSPSASACRVQRRNPGLAGIAQMRAMAEALRHDIGIANSALSFLEVEIQRRERDPPRVFRGQGLGHDGHSHKPAMARRASAPTYGDRRLEERQLPDPSGPLSRRHPANRRPLAAGVSTGSAPETDIYSGSRKIGKRSIRGLGAAPRCSLWIARRREGCTRNGR